MSNFYTPNSYDIYNTWYIDITRENNIPNILNNDILYDSSYLYQENIVNNDTNRVNDIYTTDDDIDTNYDIYDIYNDIDYTNNDTQLTIYDYISDQSINQIHIMERGDITEDERNCCICMETKETTDICRLNCTHTFCHGCITQHVEVNTRNKCCPLCRNMITTIYI